MIRRQRSVSMKLIITVAHSLSLVLVTCLLARSVAFTAPSRPVSVPRTVEHARFGAVPVSSVMARHRSARHPMFMTEDAPEAQREETIPATSPQAVRQKVAAEKEKSGLAKAVLLAVPLFCKFVIVLCIKFLTDLVVFPLLWTYRLARLTKKKILGLFGKRSSPFDGANGDVQGNKDAPNQALPPKMSKGL
ncbi:predicted protein [Phaeodactylum tricornutum CCAP 1055/1]|jgi:hypothetical protein|uniref:Transmembrane protein n=2 Tax=Phaeodactylum tricornutum TaxID=2850 RepID=B7GC27_PHATC|nr:predicted protein [Phaeodactylum tricornutum CCAP 1055/1]EEC43790.1 predicted protein [Phaeodactylum tricornutum CCAP 1055/1]|eukprot:XP_002184731.1 predicted protein [Phaeodactylum tricornutum CCAP 1055/1]